MATWTMTDLLDVRRFQSELHKVTISPESKMDLISWLNLQHRKHQTNLIEETFSKVHSQKSPRLHKSCEIKKRQRNIYKSEETEGMKINKFVILYWIPETGKKKKEYIGRKLEKL